MNTAALQRAHSDCYRQFYYEHDLVISLPLQFRRVHDTPMGADSLLIKQQLPTKIYLWLTPQRRPGVFFWSAHVYTSKCEFTKYVFTDIISSQKLEVLKRLVEEQLRAGGYTKWMTCDIISEQLQAYGFGFMGILCMSLACAIYLLTWKVTSEQINEPLFHTTSLAKDIIALAISLDCAIGWSPSGISATLALARTTHPVIQVGSATTMSMSGTTICQETDMRILPLTQVFGLSDTVSSPIDYGVISLGLGCDEHEMKLGALHFAYSYQEIFQYRKRLQERFDLPNSMSLPEKFPMWILGKSLKISLLQQRERMYANPMNPLYTQWFLQALTNVWTHAVILEQQEQQLVDIYQHFHHSKKSSHELIALVPMSTIRAGGLILFACHKAISRQTMEKMLEQLRATHYPHCFATYLSWRDGHGGSGVNVEQWVSEWVYSTYTPQGTHVVVTTLWVQHMPPDANGWDAIHTWGVVLDPICGKVHLPNIKLTHKDLPSQSWTADIVAQLVENPWKPLSNRHFSVSSYSKNKNEMMGKIIHPLIRLIKQHFDTEVDIRCTWSLFDFSLTLKDDKGILRVVKQVWK